MSAVLMPTPYRWPHRTEDVSIPKDRRTSSKASRTRAPSLRNTAPWNSFFPAEAASQTEMHWLPQPPAAYLRLVACTNCFRFLRR